MCEGDLYGALDLLHEAERLYMSDFSPNVRPIAALKTRVWVAQGRLGEALDWAREQGLSAHDDLSYVREFEHVTLARVLIARYQSDREERSIHEATGLSERLLKAAEEGERTGSVIKILVLQALAHETQGDIPAAHVPLERALTLAEPEGYVRVFVDEGMPMSRLLSEAAAHGIMPNYTGRLLAAFEAEAQGSEDRSYSLLAEPLSQRELEVLQLIAQGLSNREISERLFLALDTVKGHNRRILWQAFGTEAHRSCRKSQIPRCPPSLQLETTPPNNTEVSVGQYRAVTMPLYKRSRSTDGLSDQGQGPPGSSMDRLVRGHGDHAGRGRRHALDLPGGRSGRAHP